MRRLRRSHREANAWPLVAAIVGVPMAFYLRFGYRFGYSDQDEFLPWILSRLEPGLLESDWFLALQLAGFNIRTTFVGLLTPLSAVVGIEAALLASQFLLLALLVTSLFLIARSLGSSELGAMFAPLMILVLVPRWTIGGNALASSMLVPSTFAWALCLLAIALLFRQKHLPAGLIVGVAAWIQLLVAAQIGAICLVGLLWRDRGKGNGIWMFSVPALLLALPLVLALTSGDGGPSGTSFALLATVRAPHHYLPSSFLSTDYLRFGALAVLGVISWLHRVARPGPLDDKGSNQAMALGSGLFMGGFLALGLGAMAWLVSWDFVLLLQPFKASVLVTVLSSLALCVRAPRIRIRGAIGVGLVGVLAVGWVLLAFGTSLKGRPPADPGIGDLEPVAEWIASSTPRGAIFVVPPSTSGFRYRSKRAIVVNFKAYIFSGEGMAEWSRRLDDWAPGILPGYSGPGGTHLLAPLDSAYESIGGILADSLAKAYNVQFVVRRTPMTDTDSLFRALRVPGGWHLYERRSP